MILSESDKIKACPICKHGFGFNCRQCYPPMREKSMEIEFNTGRLYCRDGQIIKAKLVEESTLGGSQTYVRFYDTSRMIIGEFPLAKYVNVQDKHQLQGMVLANYDYGNWSNRSDY